MAYPDTLLFLGAGASASFNVPMMKEMVRLLEDDRSLLPQHQRTELEPISNVLKELYGEDYDVEKLLDVVHDLAEGRSLDVTLRELAPHALYRVHDLIVRLQPKSEVEVRTSDGQIVGGGEGYRQLEQAITEQIAKWCLEIESNKFGRYFDRFLYELWTSKPVKDRNEQPTPLQTVGTSGDHPLPRITIVTTNYDEGVESALARSGAIAETGFTFDRSKKVLRFDLGTQFDEEDKIAVIKLHGSVSWWRTSSGEVIREPHGSRGAQLLDLSHLERREIRYPVATKSLGGLPYAALYTRFAEALVAARVWLIIGYSFGDPSIVQLFDELWTPDKRLVILGPHSRTAAKRRLPPSLSRNAGFVDFSFGNEGIISALGNIGPLDPAIGRI